MRVDAIFFNEQRQFACLPLISWAYQLWHPSCDEGKRKVSKQFSWFCCIAEQWVHVIARRRPADLNIILLFIMTDAATRKSQQSEGNNRMSSAWQSLYVEPRFIQSEFIMLVERRAAHFGMVNVRAAGTPMIVYQKYTAVWSCSREQKLRSEFVHSKSKPHMKEKVVANMCARVKYAEGFWRGPGFISDQFVSRWCVVTRPPVAGILQTSVFSWPTETRTVISFLCRTIPSQLEHIT